ncbi:MAG: hypothetical protein HC905_20385 [Bacteroidales bacterium]|nr:hypothetical protein [Bacteroidales bacterium]
MVLSKLSAQNEQKKLDQGDLIFKYCPTSLLDFGFPRVEFGAAYVINPKLCLQLKSGIKMDLFRPYDDFKNDGLKLAVEYQYYIIKNLYLSVENGIIKTHLQINSVSYHKRRDR